MAFYSLRVSFIILVFLFSPVSLGKLTTFKFRGTVDYVTPEIQGAISPGESLSGSYTFDTNTPGDGIYLEPFSSASIRIASFQWKLGTPTTLLPNAIAITNDAPYDIYNPQIIPDGPRVNRYDPENFNITIWDDRGSMLSNSSLSSIPPDILSIPEGNRYWTLKFESGEWVTGTLTSLTYGGYLQSTNYGLFIGADDPVELDFVNFATNAKKMAAAFDARPNTKAYVLTGDLHSNPDGTFISPITFEKINQKLKEIRLQMRSGDTFTLYINNHGSSVETYSNGGFKTNDDGIGDEYIRVGVNLLDNALANMLSTFDGFRVTVFLDACHGGGFWGGSDQQESDQNYGYGYNDLNNLRNISLYSGAAEDKLEYVFGSWSFWGKALLEAFKKPVSWTPSGLASFLEQRTLELAWIGKQEAPVWYSLDLGDPVPADVSLIETFYENSPDFDIDETFLVEPEPISQLDDLIAAIANIGPGKSLFNKLIDIKSYYEAGDLVSTCEDLHAFINEVNAQSGKKVLVDDALKFVASAEFTMAAIDCH